MNRTMKPLAALAFLLLVSMTMAAATADTLTVRIKGMRCDECAHKVKTVLRKDAGVGALDFNLERRTVKIAYNPQLTSADSICAHLTATKRYKPTAYSPTDVIHKGMGLRMDDMHCRKCADRIIGRLSQLEGVDSLAPHLAKHYMFVRYDANRTTKAAIRALIGEIGYTPVNYYTSPKISWLYLKIPTEQATSEAIETVLGLNGVEDANVNSRRGSLAVTFFTDETTADKLLADIQAEGIQAVLPKPHVCSEKEGQQ